MEKSSKRRTPRKLKVLRYGKDKIAKPWKDFPLQVHPTGRWSRKIRGKLYHFGRWGRKDGDKLIVVENVEASAREALTEFNRQWPYLSEGRVPPAATTTTADGPMLRDVCNAFWRSKKAKLESGELSERTFAQYQQATDLLVDRWGKDRRVDDLQPTDFEALRSELAQRQGAYALKNSVNIIRMVFKFAFDNGLIEKPIRFGQSFDRPSAKSIRKARREAGPRLFEPHELRTILDCLAGEPITVEGEEKPVARKNPTLRAMVLLGLNCGFGNTDVSSLPRSAVDLDSGWIEFPRPKTEIERRIPLWPETRDALRAAIEKRPLPAGREYSDLCFVTWAGMPYTRTQPHRSKADQFVNVDGVSEQFRKLIRALKINGRKGLGFYTLRHVFETIGGESKDQVAVNALMGHADQTMAAVYRERISDERLQAVTDVVREWLFPQTAAG